MKVLDIFSWLSAEEIGLDQLEQIFKDYYTGTYMGKYTVSLKAPCKMEKDILDCSAELIEERKKIGYILKDDKVIALIAYME